MTKKQNSFPLLISTIVSCVIIVVALFILGFFGIKLGYTLGGGSQFEIYIESDANTSDYVYKINSVLGDYGLSVDSSFVGDKFVAGDEDTTFTRKCLVVQIASEGISEDEGAKIISSIAEKLEISENKISLIESVTSSVATKQVVFLGLALGIIAICFFVFGWIRYNLFAGLSFIIAFLHNIILYLSLIILTRVQLTLQSVVLAFILTILMSAILVHIYERFREKMKLTSLEKMSASEKMIASEKEVVKPFALVMGIVVFFAIITLFIQVGSISFTAINVLIAAIVTVYTTLIIGPASYLAMLEIKQLNEKAILSRNENINKQIKKKVKKNSSQSSKA